MLAASLLQRACAERVRKADRMGGFKSRGDVGQLARHRMKPDWKCDQAVRYCFPPRQTISANNDVLDLCVIDFRHVQWLVLARGLVEQGFDLVRTGFVPEISNQRKTIEDGAGHIALLRELFLLSCIQPTIGGTAFLPASF